MPELPEVETIVQGLRPYIFKRKISHLKIFLPKIIHTKKVSPNHLIGTTIENISRLGKNIIFQLSNECHLRVHLKMTGQLLIKFPEEDFQKHTHAIFSFDGERFKLNYRDIRKFGFIQIFSAEEWEKWPKESPLGPDPLEVTFSFFEEKIIKQKRMIKSVLLDQTFLAGLGNIYVDEILYHSKIHPQSLPINLSSNAVQELYQTMVKVLKTAILLRGSTIRDYLGISGEAGNYQSKHQVYGRVNAPCHKCGTLIRKIKVAGRGTCFCPTCQKLEQGRRQADPL